MKSKTVVMKLNKINMLLLGAGLLCSAGVGSAWAQTGADTTATAAKDGSLPAVTVTEKSDAGYTALPPAYSGGQVARGAGLGLLGNRDYMDVPYSIVSYTAQTIQDQQARNVSDVFKSDPSVRSIWSDGSYVNQFTVRGFAVQGQDMAVNGIYGIVPPQMTGGLEGYERVELLRGPSATLSGMAPSGAVGGTINLVTKRATDTPITQVTGSYYSNGQFGTSVDLGRRFGPDNSLGIRVNAAYRDGNTAVDSQAQRVSSVAVALDYRSRNVRLSADFGYHDMNVDSPNRVVFTDNANFQIPSAPDSSKNLGQNWYFAKSHDTYGLVRAEVDITPDVTAYAVVGGRRNDFLGLYNFIYLQNAAGNFRANQYYQPTYSNTETVQAGVSGKFDTGPLRHTVNLSATQLQIESGVLAPVISTYTSNIYNPASIAPTSLAAFSSKAPKTAQATLTSFAIADTVSMFSDRLQITAGVRNQIVQNDAFSATTGLKTTSYNKNAVTPTVGVLFKPWEQVSLYANYVEGLSQGPTAPTAGVTNPGAVFAPMKSKQAEAGAKFDVGGLGGGVSVFEIKQPNAYTNASNTYVVDGEQRNRGIEFTGFGTFAKQGRLLGGVSFIDGVLTKTSSALTDGNKAVGVPTTNLNLGAEWDFASVPGLTVSGRYIYTSSQYYNVANTQSIPSWKRVDIGARYAMNVAGKPVKVRATVENLFDSDYWASTSTNYGLSRGSPRTFLVSATVDF